MTRTTFATEYRIHRGYRGARDAPISVDEDMSRRSGDALTAADLSAAAFGRPITVVAGYPSSPDASVLGPQSKARSSEKHLGGGAKALRTGTEHRFRSLGGSREPKKTHHFGNEGSAGCFDPPLSVDDVELESRWTPLDVARPRHEASAASTESPFAAALGRVYGSHADLGEGLGSSRWSNVEMWSARSVYLRRGATLDGSADYVHRRIAKGFAQEIHG